MSTLDKFVTIANKIRLVYDSGVFDAGFEQGKEYCINGDGKTEIVNEVKAEYQAVIDNIWSRNKAYNSKRTNYQFVFAGWTDEFFKPQEPIVPVGDGANYMFIGSRVTKIDDSMVDFSKATSMTQTFTSSTINSCAVDVTSATSMDRTFTPCEALSSVTINNLSPDCTFSRTFKDCEGITDIQITGTIGQNGFDVSDCTNLSKTSLLNIINCLEDKSAGGTWTCKLGADNLAKLSAEEIDMAEEKCWALTE